MWFWAYLDGAVVEKGGGQAKVEMGHHNHGLEATELGCILLVEDDADPVDLLDVLLARLGSIRFAVFIG